MIMNKQQTTIFNQLILNVIIPTLIAFIVMTAINLRNTRDLIINANNEKNRIISGEITDLLEFQELAVSIIEKSMSGRMEQLSNMLVNEYFSDTRDIESIDLVRLRDRVGMNPETEDIYIINREGVIVNTTFSNDLGFNLFSIGEEHKNHLLHVFDTGKFVNTRFAIEASTNKPRKYTYHATADKNYIVELGAYSPEAEEVLSRIESIKSNIINDNTGIIDLEIFFMADTIFSLNSNASFYSDKINILFETFVNQDTSVVIEKEGKKWYQYLYMYMPRQNSLLYKGSVIQIVSDRTAEKNIVKKELLKLLVLLSLTLFVVILAIYRKVKVITQPIKKLVENVDRITGGHLGERAEVLGNNEIARLSVKFNMMIDELEKYYNELEQMVKDRTAKIENQKMEIQIQSDVLREQKDKLSESNKQLQSAYEEIDLQKRHIMDSIYYARRIQTAILPSPDFMKSNLKDFFILYRPKDIVSGDFYWFHTSGEKIMVAAVDCTGHGVPGAFMSIVGHNQLNYAVNVKMAGKADEILNELNRGVIETLHDQGQGSVVKDGMDLALCVFDRQMSRVEFAGANNPMVLVRDGVLTQYKGDKFPIGAYDGSRPQIFTKVDLDLRRGDMIYIYSDGYADQFGGPDDKKYTTRKFRQLLLDICDKPLDQQHDMLEESLSAWMEGYEQVDDILVIGIRI